MKMGLQPLHSSHTAGSTKDKIRSSVLPLSSTPLILDNYNSNESNRDFCACKWRLSTSVITHQKILVLLCCYIMLMAVRHKIMFSKRIVDVTKFTRDLRFQ
jgi:hypothetical protein